MQILLTVAYDGGRYVGWQRQLNGVAVQQVLEQALSLLYGAGITVTGASRTDSGVHALGQRAAFTVKTNPYPLNKLAYILNAKLPEDVVVTDARLVRGDFHACYGAKRKTYKYAIHNAPFADPTRRRYAWHVPWPLDAGLMARAAPFFIGTHDFAAFRATGGHAKTSVRTIYDMSVEREGAAITLTVTGNGFLYNMVRIIAGTLAYVGAGKIEPDSVLEIIRGGDRRAAGKTAPPYGLTLVEVMYDEEAFVVID